MRDVLADGLTTSWDLIYADSEFAVRDLVADIADVAAAVVDLGLVAETRSASGELVARLGLVHALRRALPEVPIAVLSADFTPALVNAAFANGVWLIATQDAASVIPQLSRRFLFTTRARSRAARRLY